MLPTPSTPPPRRRTTLLLAMRESRVLLEVPVNASWDHRRPRPIPTSKMPRWCSTDPFSWRCFYEPWTHCVTPAPGVAGVHAPQGWWPPARRRPVAQVKLTWIYQLGNMLCNTQCSSPRISCLLRIQASLCFGKSLTRKCSCGIHVKFTAVREDSAASFKVVFTLSDDARSV